MRKRNYVNTGKMVIIAAALAAVLSACGSSSSKAAFSNDYAVEETAAAAMEAPMMTKEMSLEEAEEDIYMAGGIANGEFGGVLSDAELNSGNKTDGTTGAIPSREDKTAERKLIKNVYLELETKEYDKLTNGIISRINSFGGYIEASNEYHPGVNDTYSRININLTARIPSERLEEFVSGVESYGNVTYKSENVTDVTLNYTDTESKKKSLEIERDRLMELMKEAESVDAIIAIEARLSEIRYEIDSRESQLRVYDNQVEYSMVSIFITEVEVLSPQSEEPLSQRLADGIKQNLRDISVFFERAFVAVVTHLPAIALVVILFAAIFIILKRTIKGKITADRKIKSAKETSIIENPSSTEKNPDLETLTGEKEIPDEEKPDRK